MADGADTGYGGYTGLYLTNPALAVALRNQQLGLPFLQQGTQSDPIRSPWQGVNRVANALLGAVLMRKGMDQVQSASDAQNAALAGALQTYQGLTQPGGGQGMPGAAPRGDSGGGDTSGTGGAAPPPAASGGAASDNPLLGPLVTTDLRGQPITGTGGGTQVAQAGNVATDAGGGGAPTGGAPGMPPTGANSPQIARAQQMLQAATEMEMKAPWDPRIKAMAAGLRQQAQLLMSLDTFAPGTKDGVRGQYNTRTGQFTADTARRMTTLADGRVINDQGEVIGYADPAGVSALAASKAQGTKTGEQGAITGNKMIDLGHDAGQAIGNIDYAVNQLNRAQEHGMPTGYFAPALSTGISIAKSLGIDTSGWGVDPQAVSDIQTAKKSLRVVGMAIVRNAIGPNADLTDAKMEHMIDAQPDIVHDPQAIQRILGWVRSNYSYQLKMATDAAQHTNNDTGMLPLGWRADFVRRNGFAPIYDPTTGEMRQPRGGESPAEELPKGPSAPAQAAPPPPQFREGQTATGPGGKKIIFKSGQWQPM